MAEMEEIQQAAMSRVPDYAVLAPILAEEEKNVEAVERTKVYIKTSTI